MSHLTLSIAQRIPIVKTILLPATHNRMMFASYGRDRVLALPSIKEPLKIEGRLFSGGEQIHHFSGLAHMAELSSTKDFVAFEFWNGSKMMIYTTFHRRGRENIYLDSNVLFSENMFHEIMFNK